MLGDRGGPKVSLFQNCVIPCARVSPSNVGSGVKLGSAGGHDKHLRSYHVGLERVFTQGLPSLPVDRCLLMEAKAGFTQRLCGFDAA